MQTARRLTSIGASVMGLTIILGAFAAHALRDKLTDYGHDIWQKAVFYQALHGMAILLLALLTQTNIINSKLAKNVCNLFLFAIITFSGSLYLLAMTDMRWLGMITPLGGLSFIIGWILVLKATLST